MEERSLKYVADVCGAEIKSGAAETKIKNAGTDSRSVQAGDLFFAIKGEKFDGHDFINEVAAKGVAAVVVEKSWVGSARCADRTPQRGVPTFRDRRITIFVLHP